MRKFLLASAALLGAASAAQAQVTMNPAPAPTTGTGNFANAAMTPAPGQIVVRLNGAFVWYAGFTGDGDANAMYWTNGATNATTAAWYATATRFVTAAGVPVTSVPVNPVTGLPVTTGLVTQRVFLRPNEAVPAGFTLNNATAGVSLPNNTPSTGAPVAPVRVRAKTDQNMSFESYIRLYPGFDGVAANGLKYGAAAEIRQDNAARGAGGAFGGVSANYPNRAGLYWRRAYGYFGTDTLGTIRVGSIDGPSNLLSTGKNYFNDAGWNGDLPTFKTANVGPAWPFMDVGNLYTPNKIVYLSPQWAGFDFGFSWAPNDNALSQNNGCALGLASVGCDRLSSIDSSANTNEQRAHRNTTELFGRYRGTFSGVGVSAFGGWIQSGHVTMNNGLGGIGSFGVGVPAAVGATTGFTRYDGLNLGLGGAQITYAGFSLGGMLQGGNSNLGYALAPSGAEKSLAWYLSATYTTGPLIVGASYFEHTYAGASIPFGNDGQNESSSNTTNFHNRVGRTRTDRGFAAGGTYAVAPGMAIYLSYLWGDRYQRGVNQLTGETVQTGSGEAGGNRRPSGDFKNLTTHQAISIGTAFRW